MKKKGGGEIKTKYFYDKNDLVIRIEDDKGNPTIFGYDSLDREIETEYADGSIEKTIYDKNSNVIQEVDCNSLIKKYTYDKLDRLKRVDIDKSQAGAVILGTLLEIFKYDGFGRMVKATNGNGITEFIFDSLGNLLTDNQNGRVVKSEYNALGFRKTLSYPSGRKLKIVPDGLNRIQRIENTALGNDYQGEAVVGSVLLNDSFVGPSRLFERQFGNGAKANFNYDGIRRTTSIKYSKNGTLLFEIQSLYDAVGNERFENKLKDSNNKGEFYTYDSLYRLIKARQGLAISSFNVNDFKPANSKTGISPDKAPTQVQIDNFINTIVLPNGNKTEFDYDSLGNRLNKKETGKPGIGYQTNNLNEYTSIDGVTPSYDKNGNMTGDGTFKYYYDYKNRLVKVEDANGNPVAKYDYDTTGRRIEKTANGKKTIFVYDGDDVIEERNDQDKVVAQYVLGEEIDEIVQMARNNKDYYYLRNSLGNVIALSGNAQSIVEEYSYSPFGIVNSVSGVENPYLFTSRRLDPETLLMYYRARHYSSELGRFLQRDPKGYENSMNLFEYVRNNPIINIDPLGLQGRDPRKYPPDQPLPELRTGEYWDFSFLSEEPSRESFERDIGEPSFLLKHAKNLWYGGLGMVFTGSLSSRLGTFFQSKTFGPSPNLTQTIRNMNRAFWLKKKGLGFLYSLKLPEVGPKVVAGSAHAGILISLWSYHRKEERLSHNLDAPASSPLSYLRYKDIVEEAKALGCEECESQALSIINFFTEGLVGFPLEDIILKRRAKEYVDQWIISHGKRQRGGGSERKIFKARPRQF